MRHAPFPVRMGLIVPRYAASNVNRGEEDFPLRRREMETRDGQRHRRNVHPCITLHLVTTARDFVRTQYAQERQREGEREREKGISEPRAKDTKEAARHNDRAKQEIDRRDARPVGSALFRTSHSRSFIIRNGGSVPFLKGDLDFLMPPRSARPRSDCDAPARIFQIPKAGGKGREIWNASRSSVQRFPSSLRNARHVTQHTKGSLCSRTKIIED